MKRIYAIPFVLSGTAMLLAAADVLPNSAVIDKGAHHRVWNHITTNIAADGKVEVRTNRYTELAIGLHYKDANGQWRESEELIEIVPGGALASKGAHQVGFAANANTLGAVNMLTSDGKRLRSHVLGLAYVDARTGQSVWIAQIRNSIGQLVAPNQILYRDAFDDGGNGTKADIRYTYRRAGLEQDVIFRADGAPPPPEAFGFNSADARLEVITEFVEAAAPQLTQFHLSGAIDAVQRAEMVLPDFSDQTIDFGAMRMQAGQAFSLNGDTVPPDAIPTGKTWHQQEGRTFLIEAVEYPAVKPHLEALMNKRAAAQQARVIGKPGIRRTFPNAPLQAKAPQETMKTAALAISERGFVIDYDITGGETNLTLAANETYFIGNGTFHVWGTTVIEGGTVVKFTNSLTAQLRFANAIDCRTAPYRPAKFTSMHDDTIGATITNSTGNPTNYCGFMVVLGNSAGGDFDLHDIHVSYAFRAFFGTTRVNANISNCQVRKSAVAFNNNTAFWNVRNVLVQDVQQAFTGGSPHTNTAEHVTFFAVSNLVANTVPTLPSIRLTNSLLIGVTNRVLWTGSNVETNLDGTGIFQSAGSGHFYLATNSPYRDAGTTNINAALLASRQQRTTFPPVALSNTMTTTNLVLAPVVARDTNAPDLGYAYDVLDYYISGLIVSNATLVVTNGAAIGADYASGNWGFILKDSRLISQGSALNLNRIVRAHMVQERSSGNPAVRAVFYDNSDVESHTNELRMRFTQFAQGANDGYMLYSGFNFGALEWTHSAIYNPSLVVDFLIDNDIACALTNTLWERGAAQFGFGSASAGTTLEARNNLFRNFRLHLNGGQPGWVVKDNLIDGDGVNGLVDGGITVTNSNNAYKHTVTNVLSGGTSNLTVTNLSYITGPFGEYYQPAGSVLINAGSTNAQQVGLYYFTTSTNQVRETNSPVDIGLHYEIVNAPPQITVPGSQTVAEDTALGITGISISDPNGNVKIEQVRLSVTHGTLTLATTNSLVFSAGSNGAATMTFQGTLSALNTAIETITYLGDLNYYGSDSLAIIVNDLANSTVGGARAVTNSVAITITPVNDPPVSSNDTYSVQKNGMLSVSAPGVLGNDSDVEGTVLTAVQVDGVSHGSLTFNANGSFTYSPTTGYIGPDSFTYKADDGTNYSAVTTVFINVTNTVNHPPTISITAPTNDSSFALGRSVEITVSVSDEDAPGVGGTIAQVQYFNAAVSLGTITTPPFSLTLNDLPLSTNTIIAVAMDDLGLSSTSSVVMFSVDTDCDGDGISDKQEARNGTGSCDLDNGLPYHLVIVAGNFQVASASSILPIDPEIEVRSAFGAPVANVSVTFTSENGGRIRENSDASWTNSITRASGVNGRASVGWALTNGPLQLLHVTLPGVASVTFSARLHREASSRLIASGRAFNLVATTNGGVWAWGTNNYGQLGDGTFTSASVTNVVQVIGLSNVISISAGMEHALAARSDGTVWGWGRNFAGELGATGFSHTNRPTQILVLSNIVQVAAGWAVSMALSRDGRVWTWGINQYGELGDCSTNDYSAAPLQVSQLSNIVHIAAGPYVTRAVTADGRLWMIGAFAPSNCPVLVPNVTNAVAVGSGGVFGAIASVLLSNGSVYHEDGCDLPDITNAVALSTSGAFSVLHVLLADGTVVQQDSLSVCTIASSTSITNVVAIAAGEGDALYLKADGSVWIGSDSGGDSPVPISFFGPFVHYAWPLLFTPLED